MPVMKFKMQADEKNIADLLFYEAMFYEAILSDCYFIFDKCKANSSYKNF